MGGKPDARFLPEDAKIIRHKVRKLIGRYGLTPSDEPDLQQELAMHVFTRMTKHNPARGARSTFVDRIVGNMIANIIERLTAKKRGHGKNVCSLHALSEEQLIDAGSGADAADLGLDLVASLAALPPALLTIALALTVDTPAEVARMPDSTPGQLRQKVAAIRKHLSAIGLEPFWKKQQPRRRRSR